MFRPVAYFKDSGRREHFVMEILSLQGVPLPLGIQDAFSYFAWHSSAFFSKEVRQFFKKKKEREREEDDDRNHYRVSFVETCHLGE
jgi:hypothetical protein